MDKPSGKGRPVDLLVEGFRLGAPGAFEAIVRAHQNRVYSFCARMLSDREDALDAAQEVFLSAWRNLAAFRGEAALSTWLLRIAANRCLNRIRRRNSLSEHEAPWPELPGETDEGIIFQPAGGEADRPDRLTETCEMGEILTKALSRLDPGSRWMVLLSDVEGFSYEEIAALADVPVGHVELVEENRRLGSEPLLLRRFQEGLPHIHHGDLDPLASGPSHLQKTSMEASERSVPPDQIGRSMKGIGRGASICLETKGKRVGSSPLNGAILPAGLICHFPCQAVPRPLRVRKPSGRIP